jgi:hypothetical protein
VLILFLWESCFLEKYHTTVKNFTAGELYTGIPITQGRCQENDFIAIPAMVDCGKAESYFLRDFRDKKDTATIHSTSLGKFLV